MKYAVGIDYSMTCPAICFFSQDVVRFWYAHETKTIVAPDVVRVATSDGESVSRRASYHAHQVCAWLASHCPVVSAVSIEDYAYSASGRVFHIGEHTGILKHYLDLRTIAITAIPPTVVKKFATGKGNADKSMMTSAFLTAYPAARDWIIQCFPRLRKDASPAKSPLADLADAYWIARYSYDRLTTAQ